MPDPTPPGDAGGTAGRPSGPLTPDAIDAVLADFRRWLEELAGEPGASVTGASLRSLTLPARQIVDLATVVAAFTALRHEVNLQTKATRAQSEQLAAALDCASITGRRPMRTPRLRPLVKAVAEVFDTLTRTTVEIDRLREEHRP